MGLKTIPFREIENQAENMYEAVAAMSGQARVELQERIVSRVILAVSYTHLTLPTISWV